ncbi:redoxin domain-containing protein [Sphingobacterium ginsenosidimutans]|uniref:Thioredoxin domain-containing protein n=2 Tax=Sphingobacterium TaxID=28453 RepID=A0ABP8A017_9SPHI
MIKQKTYSTIDFVKHILFLVSLVCSFQVQAQYGVKATQSLATVTGQKYDLSRLEDMPHVFVFYATTCPLSQKYTLTIANLNIKYANKVKFVGVFPGVEETSGQFEHFKKKYQITYPLIEDNKMVLVGSLQATVTPEAFLLDRSGKIVYHGAIDDWVVKLGKTKQVATVNYLENAIEDLLNNTKILSSYIKPIGCYIER